LVPLYKGLPLIRAGCRLQQPVDRSAPPAHPRERYPGHLSLTEPPNSDRYASHATTLARADFRLPTAPTSISVDHRVDLTGLACSGRQPRLDSQAQPLRTVHVAFPQVGLRQLLQLGV